MKHFLFSILFALCISTTFAQTTSRLVTKIEFDSVMRTVREFTGEDSTRVNGNRVRIQHRVSVKGNDLAADYLKERLVALGLTVEEIDYRSGGRNIVATRLGKLNPDSIYIIGGHYDAVADYCADDNASGCAAVLEAARIMSQFCFNNTVKYVFWDEEERGLIGSRYYADTARAHNDHILGVINVDMMAYDSDSDHVFDIHADTNWYNLKMKDTLLFLVDTLNLNLAPQVTIPGTTRSDHASFWRKGYPAVYFGESFLGGDPNPSYHTAKDRIDLFNLDYYHELVKLGVATIVELAGIVQPDRVADTVSACEQYAYRDTIFKASTFYADTLTNSNGCDSIYTLALTILQPVFKPDTVDACESYVYRDSVYLKSGIYHDTLVAGNGCDSIYVIDLRIHQPKVITDKITSCEAFSYRGTLFTQSGIYPNLFADQFGCDSLYIIDLTILRSTQLIDTVRTCTNHVYQGKILDKTGNYTYVYTRSNGCDSFYIIDLRVTHLSDSVIESGRVLSAHEDQASYQWLKCPGYTPIPNATSQSFAVLEDGFFAVEISKSQCVDTTRCIQKFVSGVPVQRQVMAHLYPNPSQGVVTIELDKNHRWMMVQIFSSSGQMIREFELNNPSEFELVLPEHEGMYLIRLITHEGQASMRVIRY